MQLFKGKTSTLLSAPKARSELEFVAGITRIILTKDDQYFERQVPLKFLPEEPAHSLHTWYNPFDRNPLQCSLLQCPQFQSRSGSKSALH